MIYVSFNMSNLKVCTWNVRRANLKSDITWSIINDMQADILCLQEVNSLPNDFDSQYSILSRNALTKEENIQKFCTVIAVKGKINKEIHLRSNLKSINKALKLFNGNLIACEITTQSGMPINVLSVYSPAWPLDGWLLDKDRDKIILNDDNKVWLTELLWDSLKQSYNNNQWIIAGDLNASTTFDLSKHMPHGNQEILDRMLNTGFIECLYNFNNKLIPTFKNASNKQVLHQMDHLFTSNTLYKKLINCEVLDNLNIFEKSISDHLPIIAEFKL